MIDSEEDYDEDEKPQKKAPPRAKPKEEPKAEVKPKTSPRKGAAAKSVNTKSIDDFFSGKKRKDPPETETNTKGSSFYSSFE